MISKGIIKRENIRILYKRSHFIFFLFFQHKEELVGHNCNIYLVNLTTGFTRQELVNFLIDKGVYFSTACNVV